MKRSRVAEQTGTAGRSISKSFRAKSGETSNVEWSGTRPSLRINSPQRGKCTLREAVLRTGGHFEQFDRKGRERLREKSSKP